MSLEIILGLIIAVIIDQRANRFLKYFLRTAYFFPYVISATAVALVWHLLLNPDLGIVNYYLGKLGIGRINWLFSTQWARVSVILVETWKNVGFYVVVFLAGLQSIPQQLYEAAEVDGAGRLQQFFHITLPLLSPTTFFLVVIGLINAFQVFDMPYVLTRGGPGGATRTVVMYIYETGFRFFNMGYAAAVSLSLFAFIAVFTFIQFRMSEKWVFYR
ncbi:MAG: sugar ABC transporter permease [Candidatus Caldatribacterium sp.]|nr:sugar ABC transporter permease [Candidatus Caldatribacterium sp.]